MAFRSFSTKKKTIIFSCNLEYLYFTVNYSNTNANEYLWRGVYNKKYDSNGLQAQYYLWKCYIALKTSRSCPLGLRSKRTLVLSVSILFYSCFFLPFFADI